MAKYHVTLKVMLGRGALYWVADVSASGEEEAIAAAEHLFEAQMESADDWSFDDYDAEIL